jgi:hypothetical protein
MHLVYMHTEGFGCEDLDGIGMGKPDDGRTLMLGAHRGDEVQHAVEYLADRLTSREAKVPGLRHELAPFGFAIQFGECCPGPITEVTLDETWFNLHLLNKARAERLCGLSRALQRR